MSSRRSRAATRWRWLLARSAGGCPRSAPLSDGSRRRVTSPAGTWVAGSGLPPDDAREPARSGAYPAVPVTVDRLPRVLSIAGSDSGGGAGIQADLKAFARCGVHGMTAITAITAQNTVAVTAVFPVPGEVIVEQVRAVMEDIGVDAVKIGMLGTRETIEAVGEALDLVGDAPVVLDPVMVAESGARLLDEDAQEALRTQLVPRAAVVTPNIPEAHVLAESDSELGGEALVRAVHALGPRAVVL